ncbi:MAG: FG-GAP-like repeat-containing protein, partial [Flavobacteriales bacterium]
TTTVGKFYIVRNQGQGVFSPPEVVCDLPTVCYTDMGDIDGDSDLDLVWSDTANGLVHVLLNDGTGHFTEHQVFPLQGPRSTTLSDLDGDGRAELIIVSSTFGGLVYRMDADDMFTLWADILVPLNSISNYVDHIVPSDLDGDGDIDLLLGRNGLDRISWLDQADCNAFEANVAWAGTDSLQATAGIHYQWFLNGDSIPGATGQSTVTTTPGEYVAMVTDDHGCVDASEPYNVITLAVNELNTPAFTVAPNPASQDLWITSSRTLDGEMRIDIFDMSGRVVSSTTRNSEQLIHLERGSIRSGIYWVRLSDAESVIGIALVVFE